MKTTDTDRKAHDTKHDELAEIARAAYKAHGPHSTECQAAMSAIRSHDATRQWSIQY